jgi:hypothetical protein
MTIKHAQLEHDFVRQIREQVATHGVARVAETYDVPEYVIEAWVAGRPRFHRFPLHQLGKKIE